jgi:Endonuclease/Exonuclease/phosphatase family
MRIVAWNCCRGPLDRKIAALETLSPDVTVLPEAIQPAKESKQLLWFPSTASSLGIQVRSGGDYRLRRLRTADLPNCVVPIRVSGPVNFNLLAVWTWPAPSYIKAFENGLSAYSRLLHPGPTVVAGDFNGNPVFDKRRRRIKRWTTAFAELEEAGLVSAYHYIHKVTFGEELHATHHFLRNPDRGFHIDYCFIPGEWANRKLKVQVVSGSEWSLLSDHFPLLVDIDA